VHARNLLIICCACLLLAIVDTGAIAQSADASGSPVVAEWIRLNETPARLSHENRTELTVLTREVQSPQAELQRNAINRIHALYDARREISPELVDLLVFAVVRPFTTQHVPVGAATLYPDVRVQALEVLGGIGGDRAINAVLLVLQQERESAVVTEALRALAEIRPPPDERLTTTLAHVITQRDVRSDPRVVAAALRTVRAIGSPPYAITDPDLYRSLLEVAQGPYPRWLRVEAYDLVDELRKPR
jgi:hypothetical protein